MGGQDERDLGHGTEADDLARALARATRLERQLVLMGEQQRALEGRLARLRGLALLAASPWLLLLSPVLLPLWIGARLVRRLRAPAAGAPFAPGGRVGRPAADPGHEARMAAEPDSFALVRVVGNDLVPRHAAGQSRGNLAVILEHEPDFPACRKLWIVNRIVDPAEAAAIVALLERHRQTFRVIPFEPAAYARAGHDFARFPVPGFLTSAALARMEPALQMRARVQASRPKNAYVMNNNGARNAALEFGLESGAKWVLPFDGNCFFTEDAWRATVAGLRARENLRYGIVPMARLVSNAEILPGGTPPEAVEEPQIAFRRDAGLRFDEAHPYGRRPKVELLARLGVAGPWDRFRLDPWDLPAGPLDADLHRTGPAGWVARLASGRADLEITTRTSANDRGEARNTAILATLAKVDTDLMRGAGWHPDRPSLYAEGPAPEPLRGRLAAAAETALGRGPFSVMQKTTLPPGGERHDYWHPAPYWWPNPRTADGLPYVLKDGERVPGTALGDPEEGRYDRARLQRMIDDATTLALAFVATGETRFRDHAARLLRAWFLDPETRMTPHLRFAQVRMGHGGNEGQPQGIIEAKDLHYLLDAVRRLDDAALADGLRGWFAAYAGWLRGSAQGVAERQAANNHGIFHDLQVFAIAGFLGDTETMCATFLDAQNRVDQHFAADGSQPHELKRTLSQHYCAFNLMGWIAFYTHAARAGLSPFAKPETARFLQGLDWMLATRDAPWPRAQIAPFDADRYAPIAAFAAALGRVEARPEDARIAAERPCLDPHDGVPLWWPLTGLSPATPAGPAP